MLVVSRPTPRIPAGTTHFKVPDPATFTQDRPSLAQAVGKSRCESAPFESAARSLAMHLRKYLVAPLL